MEPSGITSGEELLTRYCSHVPGRTSRMGLSKRRHGPSGESAMAMPMRSPSMGVELERRVLGDRMAGRRPFARVRRAGVVEDVLAADLPHDRVVRHLAVPERRPARRQRDVGELVRPFRRGRDGVDDLGVGQPVRAEGQPARPARRVVVIAAVVALHHRAAPDPVAGRAEPAVDRRRQQAILERDGPRLRRDGARPHRRGPQRREECAPPSTARHRGR